MPRPRGLRPADEVVPKLGAAPGVPALRVGDVALYDRPLEHLAGQLDRAELDLPLRFFAGRYGLVLCFATEPCDVDALAAELVRVANADGAIWLVAWKQPFLRGGAPAWEEGRRALLARGWVDHEILSLGEEIHATRFVRRRSPGASPSRAGAGLSR